MITKTRTAVVTLVAAVAVGAAAAPLASASEVPVNDIVAGGEVLAQGADGSTAAEVVIGPMDSPVLSIF